MKNLLRTDRQLRGAVVRPAPMCRRSRPPRSTANEHAGAADEWAAAAKACGLTDSDPLKLSDYDYEKVNLHSAFSSKF